MDRPRYKAPLPQDLSDGQFLIKDQYDQVIINNDDEPLVGALLDGDSITKRQLGKVIYGAELAIGIEQLLHPAIGAAVEHTGKFWRNPYRRVAVSMEPIMAVMYAEDPYRAGNYVRRLHQGIHGTDVQGRSFNALSPDAFYWAHETFRCGVEKTAEQYSQESFDEESRQQLQLESTTWYSYYGMPMQNVPADYQANQEYRQRMIDEVLTMNPSAERAISMALDRNPPRPQTVPPRLWWLAKVALMPVTEMVSMVTIGELDPAIRDKFGIPFGQRDQQQLDDFRVVAKTLIDQLPDPLRYSPQAYHSLRRDRGNIHKNMTDRLLSGGISVGSAAVRRTVQPLARRQTNIVTKRAA